MYDMQAVISIGVVTMVCCIWHRPVLYFVYHRLLKNTQIEKNKCSETGSVSVFIWKRRWTSTEIVSMYRAHRTQITRCSPTIQLEHTDTVAETLSSGFVSLYSGRRTGSKDWQLFRKINFWQCDLNLITAFQSSRLFCIAAERLLKFPHSSEWLRLLCISVLFVFNHCLLASVPRMWSRVENKPKGEGHPRTGHEGPEGK